MKKKLIFITEALWVGGIETALINLLGHLDHDKYDVTCLILRDRRELAHRLPKQCRLIAADRENWPFTWLSHLTEAPENPSFRHRCCMWLMPGLRWVEKRMFSRHVRRLLGPERYDAAIIYSDRAAEAVWAVGAGKILLFYHHGAMRRIPGDGPLWKKAERIIAVSSHQAEDLRRFRPRYSGKITVLHNLSDPEGVRRRAGEFDPDFEDGLYHIVTCGRLHRDKGMDLAVEAASLLPGNIRWHILGGGPEEGALRSLIAEKSLESKVILHGMMENPYPYIAGADLYIQPSRVEGYPMSILEAQILGKPVIATDTAGARELLGQESRCEISAAAIAAAVEAHLHAPIRPPARDWEAENREIIRNLEAIL